jgi:hypothetical protein
MKPRIEQLIAEIASLGEVFEWAGRATEQSVAALEVALGVSLPPSYRAFLLRYGAGGLRAHKGISGLSDQEACSMELGTTYGDTHRMRTERGMPSHLIVIERGDEHFPPMCLGTLRPDANGEYPVVAFWLTSRTVSTDSYPTCADYLEQSLAADLEVLREELE